MVWIWFVVWGRNGLWLELAKDDKAIGV